MLITEHEFVENEQGELLLLLEEISAEEPGDPVLLVLREEPRAYFHRGEGDIHEIAGINPNVIERLRAGDSVLVVEMKGDDVSHAYDAPSAIYEDSLAEP